MAKQTDLPNLGTLTALRAGLRPAWPAPPTLRALPTLPALPTGRLGTLRGALRAAVPNRRALTPGRLMVLAAGALVLTPSISSEQSGRPVPLRAPPVGCLISPDQVADIGSPVIGIVAAMKVDVGDRVRSGQTLLTLRAEVEAASVNAAKARAGIDADVRGAEASLALARQRYSRASELQAQGFVSAQAVDQAHAEQELAVQKLRQASGSLKVSDSDLGVVRAQLGQRKVKSGFDGIVVERWVNAGERVDDKPMLRLARLDPLRVELVVPAGRWGTVALQDRIDVLPELPGIKAVQARVTHIDPIIDAASNTFRVRLTLPNADHKLPGGARCKVDLGPVPAAAVPAPALPAQGAGQLERVGKVTG